MGLDPLLCSLVIAGFVAVVILGGITRIASLASYVVPIKASLYLGTAFVILALHYDAIVPAFKLMFSQAFGLSSLIGGTLGFTVLKALTTGFDRGLFATDAGTGIVPILQASARSSSPVGDGIATLVAPLMVMIVCTATGLVLLVTGLWQDLSLQSTNMVTAAFSKGIGSEVGGYIVIIALLLFAYTTILAWAYCGEKALGYLIGTEKARFFRYFYILLVPIGSIMHVQVIWSLADIAITLMLATNLVGVIGLASRVVDSTKEYKQSAIASKL